MGGSLKNLIFSVESQKNNISGGFSKNGVLRQFSDLRRRLSKKLGGLFGGGGGGGGGVEKLNHRLTGFSLGVRL